MMLCFAPPQSVCGRCRRYGLMCFSPENEGESCLVAHRFFRHAGMNVRLELHKISFSEYQNYLNYSYRQYVYFAAMAQPRSVLSCCISFSTKITFDPTQDKALLTNREDSQNATSNLRFKCISANFLWIHEYLQMHLGVKSPLLQGLQVLRSGLCWLKC